jgi:GntR family transcriptional regulator
MSESPPSPAFRPLFAQIQELIVERMMAGEWRHEEPLPSEAEFAKFYNVSQGTVRRAISEMTAQNLVVRYRGKGTFVARHTKEREHSHFFHLVRNDGAKDLPISRPLSCRSRRSNKEICQRLDLQAGARVGMLERLRLIGGVPVIFESIVVPEAVFPDFAAAFEEDHPNELYPFYETRYGIRVIRAVERLSAVPATAGVAKGLNLAQGAPLLEIDRVALAYGDKPVEWRRSLCNTKDYKYLSTFY